MVVRWQGRSERQQQKAIGATEDAARGRAARPGDTATVSSNPPGSGRRLTPRVAKRVAVEGEQQSSDENEGRFVERARNRQETERGETAQWFWDPPVAREDCHGADEATDHVSRL